jgi:hypothetical protein
MTAQEARYETIWKSLPYIVQSRIRQTIEHGIFSLTFYKSVSPEAFEGIKSTLFKLETLGYKTEYCEVDIEDVNVPYDITNDTKLTIMW